VHGPHDVNGVIAGQVAAGDDDGDAAIGRELGRGAGHVGRGGDLPADQR
jgi:hypothetical protein